MSATLAMLAGHHAALRLPGRPKLDLWEVNTERSYYSGKLTSRIQAALA
jgi:hypothetical protein